MTEPIELDSNNWTIASQLAKACATASDPESLMRAVVGAVLDHDWIDGDLRHALIRNMASAAWLAISDDIEDEDGNEDGTEDVVGDPWRDRDD